MAPSPGPRRFRVQARRPQTVELPAETLKAALPDWKPLHQDTLGEFGLMILLGESPAAGWDGDRYASLEGPKGEVALVVEGSRSPGFGIPAGAVLAPCRTPPVFSGEG